MTSDEKEKIKGIICSEFEHDENCLNVCALDRILKWHTAAIERRLEGLQGILQNSKLFQTNYDSVRIKYVADLFDAIRAHMKGENNEKK